MSRLGVVVGTSVIAGGLYLLAVNSPQVSEDARDKIMAGVLCGNLYSLMGDRASAMVTAASNGGLMLQEANRLGMEGPEFIEKLFQGKSPEQVSKDTREEILELDQTGLKRLLNACDSLFSIIRQPKGSQA